MSFIASRSFGTALMVCIAAASISVACSSSSNPQASGDPPGNGDTDGGTQTGDDDDDDANVDGGGGGGDGAFRQCHGTGQNTCTKAELETYSSCILNKCNTTFAECYGPDFSKGKFGGICGEAFKCFNDCACGDASCYAACPVPSEECLACGEKVGTCTSQCEEPACLKATQNPDGGSGKTCADLQACCDGKTGDDKESCVGALGAANGNDMLCNSLFTALACK